MKKRHQHHDKHTRNRQLKKQKRRLNSQLKAKIQRCITHGMPHPSSKKRLPRIRITAPRFLGFYNQHTRQAIIDWLHHLHTLVAKKRLKVFIDFTQSARPGAEAVIRILAEIDRLQGIYGKHIIRGNTPFDEITAQALEQIGLLNMIGSPTHPTPTHKEVVYWHKTSGTDVDAEKAATLLGKILNIPSEHHIDAILNGITEAMTNVTMHAYDKKIKRWHPAEKQWWMFAGIKEENLVLIICDIGIGIAKSLQLKHPTSFTDAIAQRLTDLLTGKGDDSRSIKIAMEIGKSSSNLPHRGLGMAQLHNIIDTMQQGVLSIFSNHGSYTYGYKDSEKRPETLRDHKTSIGGTIVCWRVPVEQLKLVSL